MPRTRSTTAPRLIDVARLAGVAVTTASGVLNGSPERQQQFSDACRKKVMEAAQELGYVQDVAARRLRCGRTRTIGLVMLQPLQDQAYVGVVSAVESTLHRQGCRMLLSIVNPGGAQAAVRDLLGERVEGILIGAVYYPEHIEDWWSKVPVPMVTFGGTIGSTYDEHGVDFKAAEMLAVNHLKKQGHRRIGYVRCRPESRQMMRKQGSTAGDEWFLMQDDSIEKDGSGDKLAVVHQSLPGFIARWKAADPESRATAVICRDDHTAKILLSALYLAHVRVPEELSVMGLGNIGDSALTAPPLTTVDLKIQERATLATNRLLARIEDRSLPAAHVTVRPELVVRDSVTRS